MSDISEQPAPEEETTQQRAANQKKLPVFIGIVQLICSVAALATGAAHWMLKERYTVHVGIFGAGVWAGVIFFISSLMSLGACCRASRCVLVSGMLMGIISALLLIFSALFGLRVLGSNCGYFDARIGDYCDERNVISILQIIISIIHIGCIACFGLWCCQVKAE